MVLEKYEFSSRFQQLIELFYHVFGVGYRAEDLDAEHGVYRTWGDAVPGYLFCVLDAAEYGLINVRHVELFDLGTQRFRKPSVWLNSIHVLKL
jgi:hypothetical protein